jgi:hypothetical protein
MNLTEWLWRHAISISYHLISYHSLEIYTGTIERIVEMDLREEIMRCELIELAQDTVH